MEAFALYLFKSVIWLSGFALVFILFLRNERFFHLNRLFLVSGILTSFFFPLLTVHYSVELPAVGNIQADSILSGFREVSNSNMPGAGLLLLALYLSGVLFFTFLIIKQSKSVLKCIKRGEIITSHPVKLIRTADYTSSFSFFSWVFVNPSVTAVETKEIVNHELVHIRQMHWIDLVLVELLRVLQWFNPLIWIYIRFIRQNHEYLADEVALQRTSDPAIYRATLLNQIVGSPVVSLSNSFNYSLNKKRFIMMKNTIISPYRKMKIFLILPVFAIVLYAFAKPEYRYSVKDNSGNNYPVSTVQTQGVKGTVMQQDGKPLQGATIIVKGTTLGVSTDSKGDFRLDNVPGDASLIVSYVGFKTKVFQPVFTSEMTIKMIRDTVNYGSVGTPPPPPPPPFNVRGNGNPPLVVLDGKITNIDVEKIDPNSVQSMNILKDKPATDKYGEKGKDGVIEITSKKVVLQGNENKMSDVKATGYGKVQKTDKDMMVVVEEMPRFPGGGEETMMTWISSNIKYPGKAVKKNITGKVDVNFIVDSKGKVSNVKVSKPVNPLLDAEAIRVISSMPDWKPGSQGGKPVDVFMKVPINFNLE